MDSQVTLAGSHLVYTPGDKLGHYHEGSGVSTVSDGSTLGLGRV